MSDVPVRDVWRGVAATLLALWPAYFSIEGLLTGYTRALARAAYSLHTGAAALVTATAYGLFAAALVLAGARYFSADSRRRAALFKWAWSVVIVAVVTLFSGRIVQMVQ